MSSNISVLLADDHYLITDILSAFLEAESNISVDAAHTLEEAKEKLRAGKHDIALIDYRMPGVTDTSFVGELAKESPNTKILVFSGAIPDWLAMQIVEAGASGYIPKSMSAQSIVNIICLVKSGQSFIPASLMQFANKKQRSVESLSTLEYQITKMIATGAVNKEIARELNLSDTTVKMHVRSIFSKLDVRNRTEAAIKARHFGIPE
ncbi:response regulator transcription factor [Shimia sp. CNT1-13L.2]|jgi:DNA-binding NarL/FixJ family response regulator|uniref:response regulator n=1 Tax=Shimia sp. CNT1-13L.2 TaxID=2959663 RepID=UPI0020CD006B|nr:response regulator transcription factor [Shimia sp. CNT1-13L.2]MCP9482657.1 response regulator transcription factor [Shimia sp. CNT1-13L.2]